VKGLADLKILAENAAQITAAEEYGPGAPNAGDGRLLTMMEADIRDEKFCPQAAEADFFIPVYPAVPWAGNAAL